MGEKVTRQFIDEVTGDPITGGLFRLVSKTDPLYAPIELVEIPDQFPGTPDGRYKSPTTVQTGVYRIERYVGGVWTETTDEITVEPGRWRSSGGGEMLVADYLEGVIRAGGHFDPGSNPDLVTLGTVLAYAHDNGYDTVVVGSFRGTLEWADDVQLTIPDGMFLDLAGATLRCTTPDVAPVVCEGTAFIVNGTIAGSGTGASQHITSTDANKEIVCVDVAFTGLGSAHATVTTAANGNAKATFVGCTNVVVANITTTVSVHPQTVVGGSANQVNGNLFIPSAQASATATEIGDFIRFVQSSAAPAGAEIPPGAEPFTNMRQVAAALRQLWFTERPLIANAANAVNLVYAKKDGDSGIEAQSDSNVVTFSISCALGAASATVTSVQRKATVVERGKLRIAKINVAFYALCQWNFSIGISSYVDANTFGSFALDITDIKDDLVTSFPGCNIESYISKSVANMEPISNVAGLPGGKSPGLETAVKATNPTLITFNLPSETFRWFQANNKTFAIRVEGEATLVLADGSANGVFQKYATLANL